MSDPGSQPRTTLPRAESRKRPYERADSVASRLVGAGVSVPILAFAWPHARDNGDGNQFWLSLALVAAMTLLSTVVPWARLPRWTEAIGPLVTVFGVVTMVASLGGLGSGFAIILPMPIAWLAVYGSLQEVLIGLVLLGVLLYSPLVGWVVPGLHASEPFDLATVWLTTIAIISISVHRQMRMHVRQVDGVRDAHAALELSHYAMVHDLKGPLGVMSSMAESAREFVGEDDEGVVAYLEFIGNGLRQMETLVDDVMLLHGPIAPDELIDFDPAAVILVAASQVTGVRVTSGELPASVHGNELALERTLRNLFDNSSRHARTGSGDDPVAIRVSGGPLPGGGTELLVEDDGPGVAEAELEGLFEPFRRGANATRTIGGAGLGLAIVRACTEAQGATVVAENRDEGGLRIRIRFSAGSAASAASHAQVLGPEPSART